jgi:HlyD family secretion protein
MWNRTGMDRHGKICLLFAVLSWGMLGCNHEMAEGFVGSAVVDADSWKISAQEAGPLLAVAVREGDLVRMGDTVALVDTLPLRLKLRELEAAVQELEAAVAARAAEVAVQQERQTGSERELRRASALQAEGAVSARNQDEWQTQVSVGVAQLKALRLGVEAQRARLATLRAQKASLLDQLARCVVVSPAQGRVANRYRNTGEMTSPGKPVLELLREDTLLIDAFVPQTALASYKLGQILQVRVDTGDSARWLPGHIGWISPEAEFTPKSVQTRDARNELVFRVRLRVANQDGLLKRGLPVEVWETAGH